MKIHITNLYNFNPEDALVAKQHHFTTVARTLGFLEMGIFSYPVETDTYDELSKRLDGIIAALESDDVVFIQLPTRNGYDYENLLFRKIRAYQNTKIIFILHDTTLLSVDADKELQEKYLSLYRDADAMIAPSVTEYSLLKKHGLSSALFYDSVSCIEKLTQDTTLEDCTNHNLSNSGYNVLCQQDFYLKKLFMDCIDTIFMQTKLTMLSSVKITDKEIHIGFGLHDKTGNYSVWVGVTMQSIIEHTNSKICFHIIHDDTLNVSNRNKLTQVAANGGHRVLFHQIDNSLFENYTEQMQNYTIGAMFRIMLPDVLTHLPKIIYLDADLLVNRDIKELWDIDIQNYSLAAVPDMHVVNGPVIPVPVARNEVPANRYFNSGVLYLNLERIRQNGNMSTDILDYLNNTPESNLPDQDALNTLYGNDTLLLDSSWNCFVRPMQANATKGLENKIYHYVGVICTLHSLTDVDKLYYQTTSRTPWGNEECDKQLSYSLWRTDERITHLDKLIEIINSTKKRIFYGPETNAMKNMYQLLSIRKDDYRILAEPLEEHGVTLPCQNFSLLTQEQPGTYVVFVLPQADHNSAIERLEQLGLKYHIDYFIIPFLLPPKQGGYA